MRDVGSGDAAPRRETAPSGVAPPPNEIRLAPRASAGAALAALAAASDEPTWIDAALDALESLGLTGVHLLLARRGQLELVGARGLHPAAEAALRAGRAGAEPACSEAEAALRAGRAGAEPAYSEAEAALRAGRAGAEPALAFESIEGDAARLGWHADGPSPPGLPALLAVAAGSLHRLLHGGLSDELWRATRAIEVESGGADLLEAIAVQARRLAAATHAEVRRRTVTGDERRACTAAGAAHAGEERPCCAAAAGVAHRLPLRAGRLAVGEMLIVGPPLVGAALVRLRRFCALAAARLEIERLREEVAILAQAETRTRYREERFEAALARAPITLAIQDRALRYTWVHRPVDDDVDDILGKTDFDLLAPDDALRLQMLKQRVLDSGEASHSEVAVVVRNRHRTFQMAIDPLRDPWGVVTGVAVAAIDVTTHVREAGAREQLLLQREDERSWLLSIIERSPVGILLFETDGGEERITANRRAWELLGHPVDPARARQVIAGRLLKADGSPLPLEEIPSSRALRGERVTMEEGMLRRLDGTRMPIVVSAGPIVDRDGRQAGAVVTFDDISPFKEIERMRQQWTSLITHDLRQPITSISGFASLLAEHPDLPPALRPKVVHIVAAARRLGRMTADLLECSRLESRQLALERQATDLGALIGEVIERLAAELQDHPVRLEACGGLPLLEIDPERCEQVLGNLLSNAAKYSPPGSEIVVQLERLGHEVSVGVTNQGTGLAVEELGAIFHRYHRTDLARRSRIRGLGLGLYIARGLVEAHGGRIWAESEPGRSVTFRFALPLEPPGAG